MNKILVQAFNSLGIVGILFMGSFGAIAMHRVEPNFTVLMVLSAVVALTAFILNIVFVAESKKT